MRKIRKIRRDKKGIDTILAALLMVVIVVVAAVMVYAWATGLLSALLVRRLENQPIALRVRDHKRRRGAMVRDLALRRSRLVLVRD